MEKIVRVLSRQSFNEFMSKKGWTNNERLPDNVAIIEFFNSKNLEYCLNKGEENDIDARFRFRNSKESAWFEESDVVYHIECDDILTPRSLKLPNDEIVNLVEFKYIDAISIFDFILKNKDKDMFIIHCSAGISRSGAVGAFLKTFLSDLRHDVYYPDEMGTSPNGLILDMLKTHYMGYRMFSKKIISEENYTLYPNIDENKILLLPWEIDPDSEKWLNFMKFELNLEDVSIIENIKTKSIGQLYYETMYDLDDLKEKTLNDIVEDKKY